MSNRIIICAYTSLLLCSCSLIPGLSPGDQFDDALSKSYIKDYTDAINSGTARPFVYRQRGNNYQSWGFHADSPDLVQKSILDFSTAINMGNDAEAYYRRANSYFWLAKKDLQKSEQLGYHGNKNLKNEMGSCDTRIVSSVPTDGQSYYKRAVAYYVLGYEDMRTAKLRGYSRAKSWQE